MMIIIIKQTRLTNLKMQLIKQACLGLRNERKSLVRFSVKMPVVGREEIDYDSEFRVRSYNIRDPQDRDPC